jgi:hypothetical protein
VLPPSVVLAERVRQFLQHIRTPKKTPKNKKEVILFSANEGMMQL